MNIEKLHSFFAISILFIELLVSSQNLHAENIYELRKLTEDDWLEMSTEERLRALSTAVRHVPDQTFLGDFGRYYDLYKKWGYDFYEMEDRYESYAHSDFYSTFRTIPSYNLTENRRRRWSYNEFGDRVTLLRGTGAIWREKYYDDGTYYVSNPWGYFNSDEFNNGIWVVKESTSNWAYSLIGAQSLRTSFTPLTLSIPDINGMSFDFQNENTSLKIVNSAVFGQFGSDSIIIEDKYMRKLNKVGTVMLRGGRLQRRLGALSLGTSYVTTYGIQKNRIRGSEWRGTLHAFTPTPVMVAVRFLDDSPEDSGGGPVVYDIRLRINGRYRPDIQPQIFKDDVSLEYTSASTDINEQKYLDRRGISFFSFGDPPLPKYVDYIYYNDLIRGMNGQNVFNKFSKSLANRYYTVAELSNRPLQANGTETLVCLFDLAKCTEKIHSVEAVTTVANDYRIQTAMIYTEDPKGGHNSSGNNYGWYNTTFWQTAAQAERNIKDGSNIRTITIDFGYQTANVIYGFDADFNYLGFNVRGEYVTNIQHYMFAEGLAGTGKPLQLPYIYPPRKGHRWSLTDNAYYITSSKDWDKFGFAAEIFKMGKFYRPYMDYFTFSVPILNNITRIPLIEDNDDYDRYRDNSFYSEFRESRDKDGVFPGRDEDKDGLPDTNKNFNYLPDFVEPFMMLDIDPDEFTFGTDYNNNTIPDFRENDIKLDTPYDLDRQGRHFSLRYTPQKSVNIILGSLRTMGVGISNRTYDDYAKFNLNYDVFDVGKLYAEYRYEKIQDNIRDQYFGYEQTGTMIPGHGTYLHLPVLYNSHYDELEYRNSKVNRLWIDSAIRAVPSVTLENYIKIEKNEQIEGKMYDKTFQPHDVLATFALANKLVYTKRWGNWVFSPGIKLRLYKKDRSESLQPLDHYLERIPIVMLKYVVSHRSDISFGMQGIPGCEYYYNDHIMSSNSFKRRTYTLQFQNKSEYFGYDIWASVGATLDTIDFQKPYRKVENYKTTGTFVRVYCGWE
ncbi:MAG: hypothetical protein HOC71_02285 [Candidatus Latescibacteria bacterium]|jgi:hypothetical protein|nr:hypothetical protein [Candidatus Latescibacterota bacterium]